MPTRLAALPLLAAPLLLGSATAPGGRVPTYDAAAIARFEVEGVHLGMRFDAACQHLLGVGYARGTDAAAGCARPPGPEDETFYGRRITGRRDDDGDRRAVFVSLWTELRGGVPVVNMISAVTMGTESDEALVAAQQREWGPATYDGSAAHVPWTNLIWAASPRVTERRAHYAYCVANPGCAFRAGLDCSALLAHYHGPTAEVTIYKSGRTIEISDYRAAAAALIRAGKHRRAYWAAHPPENCPGSLD